MISDIETIIESFGKGEMIILIDDEDRENEGDLVVAADHLSPEHINFMIKEGRGLVCAPISKDIVKKISKGPKSAINLIIGLFIKKC